jgi:hypothetical protein
MTFDEYQARAGTTALYQDKFYPIAMLLRDNGVDFSEVAQYNLSKLQSRAKRGVIQGSGGDR